MSAAIVATAIGVAGSAYSSNQNKKAAAKAAEQQSSGGSAADAAQQGNQQSWYDINQANNLNKQNLQWQQDQNAVDSNSAFGSTNYSRDPTTGELTANQSLNASDQANLDALRGKTSDSINALGTGFNVNGDVMNAMKAQLQPGLDTARNKENARLAAMGLGTGSGSAWGTAQDALNRSENDANQKSVLAGFDAWNTEQANNRANIASGTSYASGLKNNAPSLQAPQVSIGNIAAPENRTLDAWNYDQKQANKVYNQDIANQNSENNATGQIIGTVGSLFGNKDIRAGISNWWNPPSSSSSGDTGNSFGNVWG